MVIIVDVCFSPRSSDLEASISSMLGVCPFAVVAMGSFGGREADSVDIWGWAGRVEGWTSASDDWHNRSESKLLYMLVPAAANSMTRTIETISSFGSLHR